MLRIIVKTAATGALVAALAAVAGTAAADTAPADSAWQQTHPRREQVNQRLDNQNRRIHQDVKNGTMTPAQAAAAHHQDHQVRKEERAMASQNGGHITKTEQRALNQQENGISRKIPPK